MIDSRPRCDTVGCDKRRTETNHWFAVNVSASGILLQTWDQAEAAGRLETSRHFCGQTHALQFISGEMAK